MWWMFPFSSLTYLRKIKLSTGWFKLIRPIFFHHKYRMHLSTWMPHNWLLTTEIEGDLRH